MKRLYGKTASILFIFNLLAIFYLNFSQSLDLTAQFIVLPWLAIQSLFVLSLTYLAQGKKP